jgi:hypothetical protein
MTTHEPDGPTLAEVFAAEEQEPPTPAPRKPKRRPPTRVNRPRNLTLTPEASAALTALTRRPGGDNASAEASAAILTRATTLLPHAPT